MAAVLRGKSDHALSVFSPRCPRARHVLPVLFFRAVALTSPLKGLFSPSHLFLFSFHEGESVRCLLLLRSSHLWNGKQLIKYIRPSQNCTALHQNCTALHQNCTALHGKSPGVGYRFFLVSRTAPRPHVPMHGPWFSPGNLLIPSGKWHQFYTRLLQ